MPKANRKQKGCILTEEQTERLLVVLEQIEGMTELMFEHMESIQADNQGMTIYNVLKEKAKEADDIVKAGYSK